MSASGRARRLAILGSLYVAQGIVYGFGGFILVPMLAASGVPLTEQAGILALAGLPWIFKLLWAPLLDRFGGLGSGRARGFATAAMVAMAVCLAALASRPSLTEAPQTVAWLWLLLNVALSLQDVATDALVLDLAPSSERGLTNGVLLGGHHLGAEGIGGLGLGMLVASRGLSAALWGQAVLVALLAVLPRLLPRVAAESTERTTPRLGQAVALLLRRPATAAVALLAAVVLSADVITATVSGEFWVKRLGWSVEELSTVLAPLLLGVNLLGYGAATSIVHRRGNVGSAALGSAVLGGLWVGFGLVPGLWGASAFLMTFVAAQALATALLYVGLHAALMDATEPAVRASHFAVLMALLNLPRAAVAPAAPALLATLDYPGLFVACGAFQVVMALLIRRVLKARGP